MSEHRMEPGAGCHIREALADAVIKAHAACVSVVFSFNGKEYWVNPGDTYDTAKERAEALLGHPILTAEAERSKLKEDMERQEVEEREAIAAAGVMTEAQMRDAEVPWLKTPEDLSAYIAGLVCRPHDYGTCVYAMSMAAVAAFQYVAGTLGVTGFQASCADMDILARTRGMKDGFRIINYADLLYPQYADRFPSYRELLADENIRERLRDKAAQMLADADKLTHQNVLAHWRKLVEGE